jgi:hypothetical protein
MCQNQGDLVINGYTGKCVLSCPTTAMCPTGAECFNGTCRYRTN